MANLVFFEENHRYTVDGEEVPSVSELTRFIAREIYGEIQQTVLDTAAARGTKVHKAAEALDKFGSVEIDDDLSGYIKAYDIRLEVRYAVGVQGRRRPEVIGIAPTVAREWTVKHDTGRSFADLPLGTGLYRSQV